MFAQIPVGVGYNITEALTDGYMLQTTGHRGNITKAGCTAVFTNIFESEEPEKTGSLTISKEVRGDEELTDEQKEQAFAFAVAFSDGGSYTYRIDGGEEQTLVSGETLSLKHGESAVFAQIPVGVAYTVTEQSAEGYIPLTETYAGWIIEQGAALPFVNLPEVPAELPGSLTVEKAVLGENADPNKEFTFEVTFSGDNAPEENPRIFTLKAGESYTIADLYPTTQYTIAETDTGGYLPEFERESSAVTGGVDTTVTFINHVPAPEPEATAALRVTKELEGEIPEADNDGAFAFTLILNGEETEFALKAGETEEFEVKPGDCYEVRETDYFADGYSQSVVNGLGTVIEETVDVTVTNTFVGSVTIVAEGTKTWELGEYADTIALPEAITVRLRNGEILIAEQEVEPDENEEWHYSFTVPKYDSEGMEITYTVEEAPIVSYLASYEGYDITNTYVAPVEVSLPVTKYIEGDIAPETSFNFALTGQDDAPMPGSGGTKYISITGAGTNSFDAITFTEPGVYTYTIREIDIGRRGWTYDKSSYTLTVTVELEDGKLEKTEVLAKDGEPAEAIRFTNRYKETPIDPEKVTISGTKTWNHGGNPEANRPDSIIVYVYADGKLAVQRQITAANNWHYTFELDKFAADGHKITYTIGEAAVEDYQTDVIGYDLINTYVPDTPDVPTPSIPIDPDRTSPPTGNPFNILLWIILMIIGAAGYTISAMLRVYGKKKNR